MAEVAASVSVRASDAIAKALATTNAVALESAYASAAAAEQLADLAEAAGKTAAEPAATADGEQVSVESISLTVSDLQSQISVAGDCSLSTATACFLDSIQDLQNVEYLYPCTLLKKCLTEFTNFFTATGLLKDATLHPFIGSLSCRIYHD